MGYIKHDAIVFTAWCEEKAIPVRDKAVEFGLQVTEFVTSNVNAYVTFVVTPDGSKEGWDTSNEGNEARENLLSWVKENKIFIDWVHVSYGGDEPEYTNIQQHNK